jgi:hypothetical protein
VKMMSASDKEFGLQSRTVGAGLGIRLSGQAESEDFVHWSAARRVMVPNHRDEGVTEFYGAGVLVRGDLRIAFVRILRDDLPAEPGGTVEGVGYTVLATSRDGLHWQRNREPYLDRSPTPDAFDRAFAWACSPVIVGETVYIPYIAYNKGHKSGDRQIALATAKLDRFVARQTRGETVGTLITSLIVPRSGTWTAPRLNCDAHDGEITAQLLDADDKPIEGFTHADCEPLKTDALAAPISWKGSIDTLKGRPAKIDFRIRNAQLFGFSFDPPSTGK